MPWWGWIVVGGLLLAAEIFLSTDFYLLFFGLAALVVGGIGLVLPGTPVWSQWLIFAALAVLSLMVFRKRLRRAWAPASMPDSLPGELVVAETTVPPGSQGKGSLRGSSWRIINDSDSPLAMGDQARVESVDGVILHVRPVTSS